MLLRESLGPEAPPAPDAPRCRRLSLSPRTPSPGAIALLFSGICLVNLPADAFGSDNADDEDRSSINAAYQAAAAANRGDDAEAPLAEPEAAQFLANGGGADGDASGEQPFVGVLAAVAASACSAAAGVFMEKVYRRGEQARAIVFAFSSPLQSVTET